MAYVSAIGPEPECNHDGDEVAVWYVGIVDDDGDEIYGEPSYRLRSHDAALKAGMALAQKRRLEFVNDSAPG